MNFRCPVCFFDQMPYPPADYHICPCCGTEFGNDDMEYSYAQLRYNWVIRGARFFFGNPPNGWSAAAQLAIFGVHTEASSPPTPLNEVRIRAHGDCELELEYA